MAQAYTPGLTVAELITIRKERRLPLTGQVNVSVGDVVAAEDVVAATALPGNVTTINVAHDLHVNTEEVPRLMLKSEGDSVQARETIAEHKALWGIFHAAVGYLPRGLAQSDGRNNREYQPNYWSGADTGAGCAGGAYCIY